MEQRKQERGWHEYFAGFRVNCESIPRLPAWAVRWVVDDPRGVPYLLVWRWMDAGEIKEALRLSRRSSSFAEVEVKRTDGTSQIVETMRRRLPRNGGNALFLVCPCCGVPRRHLYGWSVVSPQRVARSLWICRTCAGLRYQSEGTYIQLWCRGLGGYPRTPPWDPWVFSSLQQMRGAGLV